jgi:DNA repair protein RadC
MAFTKEDLLSMLIEAEHKNPTKIIRTPVDAVPSLLKYAKKKQEHFIVMTLSGNHSILHVRSVTSGLVNRTVVHPREVFRPAVLDSAVAVIIAHNHPSGNLTPSPEDRAITSRLVEAGKIIGIHVLDHIIISTAGFYSFLEHDEFPEVPVPPL